MATPWLACSRLVRSLIEGGGASHTRGHELLITFDKVSKSYTNNELAVNMVSMEIAAGELFVLLGTSGSGKTTLLRMINRLEDPTSGVITVGGRSVMEQDPVALRRNIGYSVQGTRLFPHMTIGANIAITPSLLGWDNERLVHRINELLEMVGLEPDQYIHRYPSELSGGQNQRVGVARALAADPPVILMDEPFGAIDPITRDRLQDEFLQLQAHLKKTVVFVTHDVFEAFKLGDRIAILNEGMVQQVDTPEMIASVPASKFVEDFLGHNRILLLMQNRQVGELQEEYEPLVPTAAAGFTATIDVKDSLATALEKFRSANMRRLPVISESQMLGLLSVDTVTNHLIPGDCPAEGALK